MKNKEEILKRIEWIKRALNDDDCDNDVMQTRLYAQLEILNWVIQEVE